MTATATTYLKTRDVLVKAVAGADGSTYDGVDLAEGEFIALVSAFGNVDSYGDVVMPGAFADTIAAHEASGDPIPVVWAHQWADPFSHIGHVLKAWETEDGLLVHAALDLEDNPTARQVHRLLRSKRIRQFSFAFDVQEAGWGIRKNADGQDVDVYELRRLDLNEVGPCLLGVNRETELRDVKGQPPTRDTKTTADRKAEDGAASPTTPGHVTAGADIQHLTGEN